MGSQGEIASPNYTHFAAKIADFGLKYCILKKKGKNNVTGRNHRYREKLDLPVRLLESALFSPADVTNDFWGTPPVSATVSYLSPLGICRVKIRC
jgi:hypothetical protein